MRIAFLIDGGMVAWASKCQEIILLSTTESEYIVIAYFLKEVLWLQSLIRQVFVPFTYPNPLKSDNLSAIMLMQDHQYHTHQAYQHSFSVICWVVQDQNLKLISCPTEDQVANILMKALKSPKVKHFANTLGLLQD